MIMKQLRTSILFLLLPFAINAAENDLSGRVSDSNNNEPLAFVNVFFDGTDIGTTTDENGYFSISTIPNNRGILKVSMMGYESISMPMDAIPQASIEPLLIIAGFMIANPMGSK